MGLWRGDRHWFGIGSLHVGMETGVLQAMVPDIHWYWSGEMVEWVERHREKEWKERKERRREVICPWRYLWLGDSWYPDEDGEIKRDGKLREGGRREYPFLCLLTWKDRSDSRRGREGREGGREEKRKGYQFLQTLCWRDIWGGEGERGRRREEGIEGSLFLWRSIILYEDHSRPAETSSTSHQAGAQREWARQRMNTQSSRVAEREDERYGYRDTEIQTQ